MSLSPARGKGVQKKVNAKFAAGAPEVAAVQLLPHRNSLSFVGFGKSVFVPDAHGNSCVRVFSEVGWSDVQFMRQRQQHSEQQQNIRRGTHNSGIAAKLPGISAHPGLF